MKPATRRKSPPSTKTHDWLFQSAVANLGDDSIRAAAWLQLAHDLRAPTSDLVYQVTSSDPFTVKVRQYHDDHSDLQGEALTKKMDDDQLYADDDDQLTGHVGAIYIGKGSERLSKPGGSHDFHTTIDALWKIDKKPSDFIKDVRDELPKLLWDGDVKRFLSEDKETLEPVAKAVPSRYHDRTNTSWGTDLGKVGDKAKGKRSDVQKALTAALANIPA
jgi:hypothetical protein